LRRQTKIPVCGEPRQLYRIAIAAGHSFPQALDAFLAYLRPIEDAHVIVIELSDSDLCGMFPQEVLQMLSLAIDDRHNAIRDLRDCLNTIATAAPKLRNDERFRKLDEVCRRAGL
jgi:hypothetical protein